MLRYAAVRLAATVPVLLGITIVLFGLLRLIPGDPATAILLAMADPGADLSRVGEDLAALRASLGTDRPLPVQYVSWLGDLLTGNLGTSYRSGTPILDELTARLPATLELAGSAVLVAALVVVPVGVLGALHHGGGVDRVLRVVSLLGVSLPSFFLALLLIYGFSIRLGWLPTLGRGGLEHLVLPALTLGAGLAAGTSRLLRAAMLDALTQPFVRTAEAKGLPMRAIVLRHALRAALPPVLTSTGVIVGGVLGGAAVVETVFSWPGIGRYIVDAIAGRDYPVIQAFVLAMAVLFVLVNLVVELLYPLVDPRVRLGGRG